MQRCKKTTAASRKAAGDRIGSANLGAPASRRPVNQSIPLHNSPAGRRRSQENMVAGQTTIHWNTINIQGMTFGFESTRLSANENG